MKKCHGFCIVFFILFSVFLFSADADFSEIEKRERTLVYGLESDVTSLIDTLIKEKDFTYTNQLFDIYVQSQNIVVREKIILYFMNAEDYALKELVLETLEDPWDEKKQVVKAMLQYVGKLKITEAGPFILDLVKTDDEAYFENAVIALGLVGGEEEALYLAEYFQNEAPSIIKKQALMKALVNMNEEAIWDFLVETMQNEDENTYVRMYASEALGNTKKPEAVDLLIDMFSNSDINIRVYAIKGLANFNDEKTIQVLIEALKDNNYRVRLEAIEAFKKNKDERAVNSLLYRAEHDPEMSVKQKAYETLAILNTEAVRRFFKKAIENSKHNTDLRIKAVAVSLEQEIEAVYQSIFDLAKESLKDDKLKNIRYALGKEFAKYKNKAFEEVCELYLSHTDVSTKGTGLDIFITNAYVSLVPKVQAIANNDKEGANQKKARLALEKTGFDLK